VNGDTAAAFQALGVAGVIPADLAARLSRATMFLRNVQSVLRATLEGDNALAEAAETPEGVLRSVAKASGTLSTAQLQAELEKTEAWVYERFQEMIEAPAAMLPATDAPPAPTR
jgi:glutamine synthetase adenylyltransferase